MDHEWNAIDGVNEIINEKPSVFILLLLPFLSCVD